MKVTLENDFKRYVTLEEAPIVRRIIQNMKEEGGDVKEWAALAVNLAAGWGECCKTVFEAKATIAKNARVKNYYDEDSRDFDIWINCTAEATNGFYIIGAYLSDIWSIGSRIEDEINKEILSHMYIRVFKEVK